MLILQLLKLLCKLLYHAGLYSLVVQIKCKCKVLYVTGAERHVHVHYTIFEQ